MVVKVLFKFAFVRLLRLNLSFCLVFASCQCMVFYSLLAKFLP
ncbi:hypothetical protein UNSW1_1527 [Campylobacter concisus UNSW1]|nr:hypothetical protein UNSW1_1527 [Campylobacter concisus UNSW1]ERJ28906.1 hypothetical protein ATCC51561_355 [Campylobacter concisus ATCC 51561]